MITTNILFDKSIQGIYMYMAIYFNPWRVDLY